MADVVRNGETSVSDLTERCQPLVGKLHPMLPENAMRLLADLDQLYSDLLDASVAGATRWEALTLLINATIPAIDDAPRRHPRRYRMVAQPGSACYELAKINLKGRARPVKD